MLVSVIITAYDRRDFIQEAIDSVINQSLDKSRYEIITVTNFDFDPISRNTNLIKIIMDGTVGEFLECGIRVSKGEVIAFLDDDDLWEKNRLEIIADCFESVPNLSCYRNEIRNVDKNGFNMVNKFKVASIHSSPRKDEPPTLLDPNESNIVKLLGYNVVNLSSMAFRREDLDPILPIVNKIKGATDIFFFDSMVVSGKRILFDPRELTIRRIHNSNKMFSKSQKMRGRAYEETIFTYMIVDTFASTTITNNKSVSDFFNVTEMCLKIISSTFGGEKRSLIFKELIDIAKMPHLLNWKLELYALSSGLFYLIFPSSSFYSKLATLIYDANSN